jgi:hypothetical protein
MTTATTTATATATPPLEEFSERNYFVTFTSDQIKVFMLKRVPFSFVISSFSSSTCVTFLTFADSFYAASIPRLELATEEGAGEAETSRSFESSAD